MEDELWLKKIKDKLEDYSEPLPVAGWARLEKMCIRDRNKRMEENTLVFIVMITIIVVVIRWRESLEARRTASFRNPG